MSRPWPQHGPIATYGINRHHFKKLVRSALKLPESIHFNTGLLSSSPSSRRLGGRTLRVWTTVAPDSAGGCLTLLKCIEAAVGACIVSVERTPRRRTRIVRSYDRQQSKSTKQDAESHFHLPVNSRAGLCSLHPEIRFKRNRLNQTRVIPVARLAHSL